MMNRFWESIQSNPVSLTEAVRQVILAMVLFGAIQWTEQQTAGALMAVSAILALFVRSNTIAATRIERKVEEVVAHREMAGTTGTGNGMTPTATPGPATGGVSKATRAKIITMLVLSISLGAACGPKLPPSTSPEGTAAVRATQVMVALRATLPGLKALVCQPSVPEPCVSPADALQVVTKIESAADLATQLGQALALVDTVTLVDEKITAMAKARGILTNIQALLVSASITPDSVGARQVVSQLFSNVSTLLFAVQR